MAKKDPHNPDGPVEVLTTIDGDPNNVDIETIHSDRGFRKLMEDEAFMEEPVDIVILSTTDINASPIIPISVNGQQTAWLPRNKPCRVRRKFVEVLARMKESRFTQDPVTADNPSGTMREAVALAYPFQVIRDVNPRGGAWLQRIMQERG